MKFSKRLLCILTLYFMVVSCQMTPQSTTRQAVLGNAPLLPTATPRGLYLPIISGGGSGIPTPFQPMAPTALPSITPHDSPSEDKRTETVEIPPPMPLLSDDDTVNILLVGTDRRSGKSFRTDTLIVLSLRPPQQAVSLISIPRDLYVYIPGWTMQRVNTAFLHGELESYPGGGAGLLKETILYNLGIEVDHFAMVDFDGFRKAIDILGGIDVPLSCPFTDWHIIDPQVSDQDPDNWELRTIGPGLVHMDGDLALWYARSRLRSNDFDRGRRQQEILRAAYARALSLKVAPRIPELYEKLSQATSTDMSITDIFAFVPMGLNMEVANIRSYYINNQFVRSWRTPEGSAVLLPRRKRIKDMVAEAMAPPGQEEALRQEAAVEIWNLSPNPDLGALASERLNYAGFSTYIVNPLVPPSAPDQTTLYDFHKAGEDENGKVLLAVLGLPPNRLVEEASQESRSIYRLVLREDYDPCFNPADLVH